MRHEWLDLHLFKTVEQVQGEAEAKDILWCLDAMQEWEDFILSVYGPKEDES